MIRKQGENPNSLPRNLYFTFCGDLLASGGAHYEKGHRTSLDEAIRLANRHYSDDFSESLAMWQLRNSLWKNDLKSLMAQRNVFLDVIRTHFSAHSQQYSPWATALFAENCIDKYAELLVNHSSCGLAMRATALGSSSLTLEQVMPLFLITHANVQAVSGGYYILGMARAFLEGNALSFAMIAAEAAEKRGRSLSLDFLESHNLPNLRDIRPSSSVRYVCEKRDPYCVIKDINQDGIETHFAVSAVILILNEIEWFDVKNGAAHVVLRAMEIGGDPDTIASIAMGLYGLWQKDRAEAELSKILL